MWFLYRVCVGCLRIECDMDFTVDFILGQLAAPA